MGGFLALVPSLVPAIGTIVTDVVNAVKGGATATSASKDATAPSGDTATSIAGDTNFQSAVQNRQKNNAANAAAAAVPATAVQAGASKSLSASGSVAQSLSKQLQAVVALLKPCYEAEDCVYAMMQIAGKAKLDDDDKSSLSNQWTTADKNIKQLSVGLVGSIADPSAQNAFQAVIDAVNKILYTQIDDGLKVIGDSLSNEIQTDINDLWIWLDGATRAGMTTIESISQGLDQIAAVAPTAPLAAGVGAEP